MTDYDLPIDVATEVTHEVTHTLMNGPKWKEEREGWARELTVYGRMPDALRVPESKFYYLWFARMVDPDGFDRRTCELYKGGFKC